MFKRRLSTLAAAIAIASLLPGVGLANAETNSVDNFTRLQAAQEARKFYDVPTGLAPWSPECTIFVSQSLWAGGMEPTDDWTGNTSDESKLASRKFANPGPTKAAANADLFVKYMVSSGRATKMRISWSDNTARDAELADVVAYDWDGGTDGTIDHLAIVTGFTDDGYPLVTQRTPARLNRGWSWDVGGGDWIEYTHPNSTAYLIHLN